jgi:CxxC-x17-CxxC domain-containing protein
MNDFKKRPYNSRDSRPSSFARPSHNRPGASRPSFGDKRQTEFFKATCSKCHKDCDVPFKPNGKKPVFCKDCFVRDDAPQGGNSYGNSSRGEYSNDRYSNDRGSDRGDRNDRGNDRPYAAKPADDGRITAMQKELASINAKLDVIIQTVGSAAYASILNSSSDRKEVKQVKEAKKEVVVEEKPKTKKAATKAPAKVKKVAKKK